MRFIGSACVAIAVLWIVDQANGGKYTSAVMALTRRIFGF